MVLEMISQIRNINKEQYENVCKRLFALKKSFCFKVHSTRCGQMKLFMIFSFTQREYKDIKLILNLFLKIYCFADHYSARYKPDFNNIKEILKTQQSQYEIQHILICICTQHCAVLRITRIMLCIHAVFTYDFLRTVHIKFSRLTYFIQCLYLSFYLYI